MKEDGQAANENGQAVNLDLSEHELLLREGTSISDKINLLDTLDTFIATIPAGILLGYLIDALDQISDLGGLNIFLEMIILPTAPTAVFSAVYMALRYEMKYRALKEKLPSLVTISNIILMMRIYGRMMAHLMKWPK